MLKMKERIAAIVVTYNRKNSLINCLEAILKQSHPVDIIYIIDNHSIDGTPELLLERQYIKELPVHQCGVNQINYYAIQLIA